MPIEFRFSEVLDEITAIRELAGPLIEPNYLWMLDTFKISLETIRSKRVKASWELPQVNALRTRACDGGYEKSPRQGGIGGLYGEVSAVWEIEPIVGNTKRNVLPTNFVIAGKASTKLRLVEDTKDGRNEHACWRMEVGDLKSPGSFFHIQYGESDAASSMYQPLPIPRIPCPPTTPLLAIEYLVAELFQDAWPERLIAQKNQAQQWRHLQLKRHEAFAAWQATVLSERSGSVVVNLKAAKPKPTLLTGFNSN